MNAIKNQYTDNIKWSALEAIVLQVLLFANQYILFRSVELSLYGIIGTLFGLIYFSVKLFDLGFSKSLTTFYDDYSHNKSMFCYFFKKQLRPNIYFYFFGSFLVLAIKLLFFPQNSFLLRFDTPLLILALTLVATESVKFILKRLQHLSNNFRRTALLEMICAALYHIVLLLYYFTGMPLTVHVIFGSFLIISAFEATLLLFWGYNWFLNLPSNSTPLSEDNFFIVKNRFFLYSYTLGKQLFSANILIPLFAYSHGFECAALLKFSSYITHTIVSIVGRIIDPASSVFFSKIQKSTTGEKQSGFLFASQILYHILFCIIIFMGINSNKLMTNTNASAINSITLFYMIFYFLINFAETFFIAIEELYIVHGRPEYLLISMSVNYGLMIIFTILPISPFYILPSLLLFRILSFFILIFYISSLWSIKHSITVHPRYFLGSLLLSLVYFIIF